MKLEPLMKTIPAFAITASNKKHLIPSIYFESDHLGPYTKSTQTTGTQTQTKEKKTYTTKKREKWLEFHYVLHNMYSNQQQWTLLYSLLFRRTDPEQTMSGQDDYENLSRECWAQA